MHTFVTSLGEFTPTLEDVSMMFRLPIFVDKGATGLVLSEEEERRLQLPIAALGVINKSTCTSWVRYFREGEGQRKEMRLEAFCYTGCPGIPSSWPEVDINACVPLNHPSCEGEESPT